MIVYDSELKIFYSDKINSARYFSGFATRELGDARNTEVITRFLKEEETPSRRIVTLEQIHSANVSHYVTNDEAHAENIEETDGVVTKESNVALTVLTADCTPIVYVDKEAEVIGISHQGWRGLLKKLPQKLIESMEKEGARRDHLVASLGPAIGDCCYDISEDRYAEFASEYEEYVGQIFRERKGKWYLNLSLLSYLLLVEGGVQKENIDFFPFCTSCDKKRFFSARRAKTPKSERQFSFIIKNEKK
ncbi:peptidoglycan editing factor PgeF [Candidatus Roizmanbacteria bacterium]|nr:peptidoglycan editing factor PgeF [Candidatus Roizmanbacteria bacterium]